MELDYAGFVVLPIHTQILPSLIMSSAFPSLLAPSGIKIGPRFSIYKYFLSESQYLL